MPLCGFLKLGTAVDVLLGPFIDDTDGKSAETGLSPDVEISKNGQALANKNDATVPTHDAAGDVDGYYNCELDETDTGTLGIITLVAHAAGFLPVRQDYQIVPAIVYDALYAAATTDYLQVDVVQVAGTAQTANDIGADVNEILTDTAVIGALGAGLTAVADKTTLDLIHTDVDAVLADTTVIGATGQGLTSLATQASVNTIDDFLDTEVADIKAKTDLIPADITTQLDTNIPAIKAKTDLLPADTATQLDTNIPAIKAKTDLIPADITTQLDTNIPAILADTGTDGVVVATASKTGYALSAAGIQAIWDALTSALTTVASIGKKLADWVVGTIDTYTGNTKQTGDSYTRLGAPAGASVSADIADTHTDIGSAITKIDAVDDFVDTEVASILGAVDNEVAAIKGVTDKVDTALVLDGAVYQFTANALELAPAGGGGGDATLANQTRIIQILTGKWEITGNQLKMYDSDGTTVLYTFNLTQDGVATEFNPDKRELV